MTILIVDDDYLNRRTTRKYLEQNSYHVLEAKNAKEALDILANECTDLVILDIHLGEGEQDGINIGQYIHEKYAIPFLYLTAYESSEIISKAIATMPYSYLTKPFKNVDLIASVEVALRQSSARVAEVPTVMVKDGDYNVALPVDSINFIQSEGNYLLVYTDDVTYKCRATITQFIQDLPPTDFLQTHRAYVANRKKIERYNSKSLFINKTEIPLSKKFRPKLKLQELASQKSV